jgi:hypothetical protein
MYSRGVSDEVQLLHPLHIGRVVSHLPGRDSLLIHLIEFGRIALRRLGNEEVDYYATNCPRAKEQPCSFITPVRAVHIHL